VAAVGVRYTVELRPCAIYRAAGFACPRFGSKLSGKLLGRFATRRGISDIDAFDEADAFGPSATTADAQHIATRLHTKPDSIRRIKADIRSPPKATFA
jgi:hypothetical protein